MLNGLKTARDTVILAGGVLVAIGRHQLHQRGYGNPSSGRTCDGCW